MVPPSRIQLHNDDQALRDTGLSTLKSTVFSHRSKFLSTQWYCEIVRSLVHHSKCTARVHKRGGGLPSSFCGVVGLAKVGLN